MAKEVKKKDTIVVVFDFLLLLVMVLFILVILSRKVSSEPEDVCKYVKEDVQMVMLLKQNGVDPQTLKSVINGSTEEYKIYYKFVVDLVYDNETEGNKDNFISIVEDKFNEECYQ